MKDILKPTGHVPEKLLIPENLSQGQPIHRRGTNLLQMYPSAGVQNYACSMVLTSMAYPLSVKSTSGEKKPNPTQWRTIPQNTFPQNQLCEKQSPTRRLKKKEKERMYR